MHVAKPIQPAEPGAVVASVAAARGQDAVKGSCVHILRAARVRATYRHSRREVQA
jgi:hypothetical protein